MPSVPAPAPAPPAPPLREHPFTTAGIALAAVVAPLLLAGCGGGGGGGEVAAAPAVPPALTITTLTVDVTASEPATIAVSGVADQDAAAGATGSVRFRLGVDRPADPGLAGAERAYAFSATATAAGSTAEGHVEVRINADPVAAIAGQTAAVAAITKLHHRACFGLSTQDLVRWLKLPYATMVDQLVDATGGATAQDPPAWVDEPVKLASEITDRDAHDAQKGARIQELKRWWLREMVRSASPLTERMTLFWSNHLVTASWDIFEPQVTWRYLKLLRQHATGSFADLVHAIAKEPAMVMFLDSDSNVKGKPNENFARELLELFTLGEGMDYTEGDIVELAKCFTGYGLTARKLYEYKPTRHEPGAKTLFGQSIQNDLDGEKDGEDAIDLILAKTRCARFIAEKLCVEFIGTVPGDIATIAADFQASGYQLKPLLKRILTHGAFTSSAAGAMLRSPADLHVGLWRALELEPTDWGSETWMLSEEEMDLLDPPNVRGWVGGDAWVTSRTLLRRREFMGWKQWDLWNRHNPRLRAILPTLLMPIAPHDQAVLDPAAYPSWDQVGGPFRALYLDPAMHLK